jgi:hypothetical protein
MRAMLVRASRSAAIRTRLDEDTVRDRLAALAARPAPEGIRELVAAGGFEGWSVGPREFRLDYRVNNPKNLQSYAVRGTMQDARDWRIVRLKLTAHDPWLGRPDAITNRIASLIASKVNGSVQQRSEWVVPEA